MTALVQRLHCLMFSFLLDCWVLDGDVWLADPEEWGTVGWVDA